MNQKLAYICGTKSWGGLEMNQLRNAVWMQERGHQVVVLCLADSPLEQNATASGVQTIQIAKHRKYYDFIKGRRLAKIIKQEEITHLIVRSTYDMSIAAFVKWKLGKKLHLSYFMEMQLGISKRNLLHTFRFRWFDLWFCPLIWLSDQVVKMTRFPKDRIRVVPSGLNLQQFEINLPKVEARNILQLPNSVFLFGLIGRFDINKGQLLLLDAMQKCTDKGFSVVLLGEPTHNEGDTYFLQMQERIERNQLKDRVYILPFRKDISVFYRAIDCFVMASNAETFGMVTIEAMANGTQILGSNSGGTPEILQQGKLGLLFEKLNIDDLSEKLQIIAHGHIQATSSDLKAASRKYDHYTVCSMVEKELELNRN